MWYSTKIVIFFNIYIHKMQNLPFLLQIDNEITQISQVICGTRFRRC